MKKFFIYLISSLCLLIGINIALASTNNVVISDKYNSWSDLINGINNTGSTTNRYIYLGLSGSTMPNWDGYYGEKYRIYYNTGGTDILIQTGSFIDTINGNNYINFNTSNIPLDYSNVNIKVGLIESDGITENLSNNYSISFDNSAIPRIKMNISANYLSINGIFNYPNLTVTNDRLAPSNISNYLNVKTLGIAVDGNILYETIDNTSTGEVKVSSSFSNNSNIPIFASGGYVFGSSGGGLHIGGMGRNKPTYYGEHGTTHTISFLNTASLNIIDLNNNPILSDDYTYIVDNIIDSGSYIVTESGSNYIFSGTNLIDNHSGISDNENNFYWSTGTSLSDSGIYQWDQPKLGTGKILTLPKDNFIGANLDDVIIKFQIADKVGNTKVITKTLSGAINDGMLNLQDLNQDPEDTNTGSINNPTLINTGSTSSNTGAITLISTGSLENGGILNISGTILNIISDIQDIDSITGSLILSGITNISASGGSWNGILLPPSLINQSLTGAATISELNTLIQSLNNGNTTYTGTVIQTIKVGAEGVSLYANSGSNFFVSFIVPTSNSGTVLKLYRSSDGSNWEINSPDSECTLDSNKTCSFYTNHLSYFAPTLVTGQTITNNNTGISSGGGGGGVSRDFCPTGDYSASYYDGKCGEGIVTNSNTGNSINSTSITNDLKTLVKSFIKKEYLINSIKLNIYNPQFDNKLQSKIDKITEIIINKIKKSSIDSAKTKKIINEYNKLLIGLKLKTIKDNRWEKISKNAVTNLKEFFK